ncbi:precorrin-2 dehydrogenase/sirohydrochlorin ferrochelatase family protein [Vibrio sp. SCSIO 43137]|uniref:precorrin-2 dehydrogenase/sirohydrochlorin ferrochelatase family protein n=1 Tax=Vibrio sp. SCSIO 43137 TaxID=3021011 RepID=UPI002307219E|nr:NAD(P)-dependent oxidoreductase [Vibrio sp. SCSIO 43137]WCE31073.1 NAD(P)-dependent oxidoreductase [Vibrio sp. SCSIO 43137]
MQYFPLFYNLTNKPVLVVGGGEVASRKVDMLVRAGADVTIVSPQVTPFLQDLISRKQCRWIEGVYNKEHQSGMVQVWATTDDKPLNHLVHKNAKSDGIMVNVVDDKPYCDFITPSMVNRGRIQVAISSGGASPVLVRRIRETIETSLAQNLELIADFAMDKREDVQSRFSSVSQRRVFWQNFFDSPAIDSAGSKEELETLYKTILKQGIKETLSRNWLEFGCDADSLSLKTLRTMQKAEVVFYPADCPFEFIDLCRRDAERVEYKNLHDLQQLLGNAENENMTDICIFIPRGEMSANQKLADFAKNEALFRVVE